MKTDKNFFTWTRQKTKHMDLNFKVHTLLPTEQNLENFGSQG